MIKRVMTGCSAPALKIKAATGKMYWLACSSSSTVAQRLRYGGMPSGCGNK
jgi:hypothetical protein